MAIVIKMPLPSTRKRIYAFSFTGFPLRFLSRLPRYYYLPSHYVPLPITSSLARILLIERLYRPLGSSTAVRASARAPRIFSDI
jgi:hypothetical protein